jgi:hypothetical protein
VSFRSGALEAILRWELARGNKVRDQGAWPPNCPLLVMLDRPFGRRHGGAVYEALNDPHYWQASYSDPATGEVLACGF